MCVIRLFHPVAAAAAVMALPASFAMAESGQSRNPLQFAHNCQCLAAERHYAQGAVACINGRRLKCGMSLNVSSWLVLEGTCTPNRVSQWRATPRAEPTPATFAPL